METFEIIADDVHAPEASGENVSAKARVVVSDRVENEVQKELSVDYHHVEVDIRIALDFRVDRKIRDSFVFIERETHEIGSFNDGSVVINHRYIGLLSFVLSDDLSKIESVNAVAVEENNVIVGALAEESRNALQSLEASIV